MGTLNVLRIKRKAADAPLTTLVIEPGDSRARKRTKANLSRVAQEAASNANVTQRQSDNEQGSSGVGGGGRVFRLAQTVGREWRGVGKEGEAFMAHIHRLLAGEESPSVEATDPSTNTHSDEMAGSSSISAKKAHPKERRYQIVRHAASLDPMGSGRRRIASMGTSRRRLGQGSTPNSRPGTPSQATVPGIRFIDARPEPETRPNSVPSSGRETPAQRDTSAADQLDDEGDVKMKDLEKFLPMLQETPSQPSSQSPRRRAPVPIGPPPPIAPPHMLSAAQRSFLPDPSSSSSSSRRTTPVVPAGGKEEEEGEWVYDLYYLDSGDAASTSTGNEGSTSKPSEAATAGAIGALTGLDEFLDEENDPGSDTEEGDEADEDSNDEDFYRNDYPEDEDAASEDERWGRDRRARNGFVYGDELDDDRDGFDTDEEPVHPLHKPIGRVPGLEDMNDDDYDPDDYDSDEIPVQRWRPEMDD